MLWIHPLLVSQENSCIFVFATHNFTAFEEQTYRYSPHDRVLLMLEIDTLDPNLVDEDRNLASEPFFPGKSA